MSGTSVNTGQEIDASDLGNITFLPAQDETTQATFERKAHDGTARSATGATARFLITPVNDAPTITDISDQVGTGGVTLGPIAFTISDVDDTLSCTGSMTGDSSNSLIMTMTGITFSGTAPSCELYLLAYTGASGATTVTIAVSDGSLTGADTFTFTVSQTNDAPFVDDWTKSITEDITGAFTTRDRTGAYSDPDDDTISKIEIVSLPTHGTLAVSGNAATTGQEVDYIDLDDITYLPAQDETTQTTFDRKAHDGTARSATGATVTLSITPVNDAPTISDIPDDTIDEGTSLTDEPFTITDVDDTLDCASDVVVTTDTDVIPV